MPKPKVFFALTTTHGLMQTMFVPTLMNLFNDRPYDMVLWQYTDCYTPLARNAAANDFMMGVCTHICFLDVDILDPQIVQHVSRMLGHDEPIVCGLYPKKDESKLQWCGNALPDRPPPDERGLLSMKHVGTGFMLIKREVIEKMIEDHGDDITYYEDETDRKMYDLFDMPRMKDDGGMVRKLSEDWYFCNVARALGYKVWADTHVLTMHVGTAVFPLRHQAARTKINVIPADMGEK